MFETELTLFKNKKKNFFPRLSITVYFKTKNFAIYIMAMFYLMRSVRVRRGSFSFSSSFISYWLRYYATTIVLVYHSHTIQKSGSSRRGLYSLKLALKTPRRFTFMTRCHVSEQGSIIYNDEKDLGLLVLKNLLTQVVYSNLAWRRANLKRNKNSTKNTEKK